MFHARAKLANTLLQGGFRLLSSLADYAGNRGWGVEVVPFSPETQQIALENPAHLHVFMDDRPVYAPNAFYSVPTYLRGFWYFDEIGTRNNSTLRLRQFDPRLIADKFAKEFHAKLVDQFIGRNFSKFPQPERGSEAVSAGCLALFAQGFKAPRYHHEYLSVPGLIEAAIAARGDRPLYIKPHPNNTIEELAYLFGLHDPEHGVFVTQASIHDILEKCVCVLTVTSAVGFEAFLHKKPVILAGQTDFTHNAITLTDASQLAKAIQAAMQRDWPYERFLTWFLRKNCVEDHPRALPIVLDRLHRKGFLLGNTGTGFY